MPGLFKCDSELGELPANVFFEESVPYQEFDLIGVCIGENLVWIAQVENSGPRVLVLIVFCRYEICC